jgi:hypothetical protein
VFGGNKVSHMLPYASLQPVGSGADADVFGENAARISLSGVQEKFSLIQVKNKIRLTQEGEPGTHILKPILGVSSLQCSYLARTGCIERTSKLTLKPPLMEVFTGLTPTCSSNYKAFLEALPDKRFRTFLAACR